MIIDEYVTHPSLDDSILVEGGENKTDDLGFLLSLARGIHRMTCRFLISGTTPVCNRGQ